MPRDCGDLFIVCFAVVLVVSAARLCYCIRVTGSIAGKRCQHSYSSQIWAEVLTKIQIILNTSNPIPQRGHSSSVDEQETVLGLQDGAAQPYAN